MRSPLLAVLALLGAAGLARADYLLIVINLNQNTQATGNQNGRPGGLGMIGAPPGMGGATGMQGPRPGAGGGAMGGVGMQGPRPGAGGPNGGGFGFAGMQGPGPGAAPPTDADDDDDLIVTVLEVDNKTSATRKKFALGQPTLFTHHHAPGGVGKVMLVNKTSQYEVMFLEPSTGVAMPTVASRYKNRLADTFKDKEKPSTEKALETARWALEHGLTDECAQVMDRLAEFDKSNTAVVAYLKIKADLARPVARAASGQDMAERIKVQVLPGSKVTEDDHGHYALVHPDGANDEAKAQLARLERSFRNYYYWWALRGITLPVPTQRQVAVLTSKDDDFRKLRKHLTASPVLAASFAARREGIAVFANKRNDLIYDKLDKATESLFKADTAFDRYKILKGVGRAGIPKTVRDLNSVHGVRTTALVLKLLENEWEQTATSHEASRQLLFASGLLPHNVHAPEWVQFGAGSFMETSLQSPWPTVGAFNPYWGPRFKELLKASTKSTEKDPRKKYEASPRDTMLKVVTDSYFREKVLVEDHPGEKPEEKRSRQAKAQEAQLRKARASAWALYYFLAKQHMPRLRDYFRELSRQPRDMELDARTLEECFKRAFAGQDLYALANQWIQFLKSDTPQAEAIHKKISEYHEKMNKARARPAAGQPGFGGPGFPGPGGPGMGPGMGGFPGRPGGAGGRPGGG